MRLDVRVYALYYVVCLDVCYLVTHNVCMRARRDLVCFLGNPRLDLVESHNPLRDYMCIRNRT